MILKTNKLIEQMEMPRHDKHFLFFGNKNSGDGAAAKILSERTGEFLISFENQRIFGESFDILEAE